MQNVSSSNSQAVNAPQLRFPSFTKEWHKCELSSIFKKSSIKNKDGKITNVISNSAKNGLIPQTDYFDKEIANSENTAGYYIINKGDFVYNPRKSTEAPFGPISVYDYENTGIVSPLYLCFKPQHEISTTFFKWMFKSPVWHRYIYMSGDSGARHDRVSMRDEVFFSMPLSIPEEAEQIKIADFLSHIEKRIEKQQVLVDNLKLYKRGVIVSLFKSLSENCDNIKLSKIGSFKSGVGFKESYQGYLNLEIPFYKVSDMNLDGNTITMNTANNYVSNEIVKKLKTTPFNQDSIIFAKVGAALFMERKRIANAPFLIDNNMMAYQPNANVNFEYVFAFFQNLSLSAYAQIGALPSLNASELGDIIIPMPDAKKQKKVALINKELEMQIDAHTQCLIRLEEVKRGLLQQMFI